ncbi:hypothetical protein J3U57_06185 [Gilliamella sp. B3464]|uniref:hypothetical protein n=1 Tax=unclassified Gilliamella TaxID=2685620 RepID=UPI00226AC8F0|nr:MULTISPECIES: hypothetical protein [unclassified Gilliamella]MCX8712299.1 hypothetical protein [Gilliamella sp. B3468]MCX8751155.1 hypothetical protein [Gilliamella sp. B3464]
MKQLASTVRVIEWEELPARARDIPDNFNPLFDGVLMKHQIEALKIQAAILAVPKGRRTGITFAFSFEAVLVAGARKSAGGMNVFYIGDTKEKGLEFIGYCAKFSKVIAEQQSSSVSSIEEFLFEDVDENKNSRYITAYRIRFSSGYQITALSSRPANIRGLQGLVIIDEAAFHQDVQGVLDAATALLIWGGRIIVISSHNGKSNPFNQFVIDIENGIYGNTAQVYRVTFDDAVANGLYERVCYMKGEEPTIESKKKWYTTIRNSYGPNKAAMREELDAIPRDGQGVCIPGVWIERAMREERPVLRLICGDDFAEKDELDRISWCDNWIQQDIEPLIAVLNHQHEHVFGMDFARHRHFSVIWPMAIEQNLMRKVPFSVELNNVPSAQQQQILFFIISKLPRLMGGAMDATGPGMVLAEYTADKFGRPFIAEINLNRQWYGLWMQKFISAFEDGTIDIPRDSNIEQDLRAVRSVDGIPMVPKLERKDLKDPDLVRHGDSAIAGCLAWYATLNKMAQIEGQSTGERDIYHQLYGYVNDSSFGQFADTGFGTVRGGNDFGGFI